jgi:ribose transport system permease protein
VPVGVLAGLVVVGSVLVRGFVSGTHIESMADTGIFVGVLGVGQMLAIVTGGIDLSLPYMVNLSAVLIAGISGGSDGRAAEALAAALGVGALVGATNGVGIGYLGIPPLVMTLAMNGVLEGITLLYTGGTPFGSAPPVVVGAASGHAGPVTVGVWIWMGVSVLAAVVLVRTTFGRRIFAVGAAPRAAVLSGVRRPRVLVGVYCIVSVLGALGGALLVGYAGQAFIGMGDEYLLVSVAVVVIGGASIYGGSGDVLGTFIGSCVIIVLTDLLVLLNLGQNWQDVIYGGVILSVLVGARGVSGKRSMT